jgi:UDP-N-acetylmuramate--alanine ligase
MVFSPPALPMRSIKKVFFIGIGGVGMSGIAEVMANLNYQVYGSDFHLGNTTERLTKLGVTIYPNHSAKNIIDMDVVVVSSAISQDNVEVKSALEHRIPVIRRAEMLAELMRFRHGIAIAGTHGKTTTTSLVATVLGEAGLDPTFIVGGRVNSIETNSRLGEGQFMIVEADESDASFLHLQPMISVITNIDADHLSFYENDFVKLRTAFIEFIHNLPFYGLVILCVDNEVVRGIIPELSRPYLTYGLSADADVRAKNINYKGDKTSFELHTKQNDDPYLVTLNLPGEHNVLNALASIAVGLELNIPIEKIAEALDNFAGIGRRMQKTGTLSLDGGLVEYMDDYAHHPREVEATFNAVRNAWPEKRLVTIFQPHRYTRTQDLFDDFVQVLNQSDVLVLLNVYSAGEKPINKADSHALGRALRLLGKLEPLVLDDDNNLADVISKIILPNDLVLTLGAGSIGKLASQLPEQVRQALT